MLRGFLTTIFFFIVICDPVDSHGDSSFDKSLGVLFKKSDLVIIGASRQQSPPCLHGLEFKYDFNISRFCKGRLELNTISVFTTSHVWPGTPYLLFLNERKKTKVTNQVSTDKNVKHNKVEREFICIEIFSPLGSGKFNYEEAIKWLDQGLNVNNLKKVKNN